MEMTSSVRQKMIKDILTASKRVNQQVDQFKRFEEKMQEKRKEGTLTQKESDKLQAMGYSKLLYHLKRYYRDQNEPIQGKQKMKGMLYKDDAGYIKIERNQEKLEALNEEDLQNLHDRILGNKTHEQMDDYGWIGLANYKTATRMGSQRAENKSYDNFIEGRKALAEEKYEKLKELHEKQPERNPEPVAPIPVKLSREDMRDFWRIYNQTRNEIKDKEARNQFYSVFFDFVDNSQYGDNVFKWDATVLKEVMQKAAHFNLLKKDTIETIHKWYLETFGDI